MKQLFFKVFTLSLIFISQIVYAQDNKWSVSFSLEKNEYRGSQSTNGFFSFKEGGESPELSMYMGGGIGLNRYLSSSFDTKLVLSYGSYGFPKLFWSDDRFDGSLQLIYKLNNGAILPENSKVAPFLYTGIGLTSMSSNKSEKKSSYFFPLGIGVNYAITSSISLQYHFSFSITTEDYVDGLVDVPNPIGDNFMKHSLGFVIALGGAGGGAKGGGYYYKHRKRR